MYRSVIIFFVCLSLLSRVDAQGKVSVEMLDRIDSLIKYKLQEGSTDSLSALYLERANAKLSLFSEIGEALYDLQTAATYARYNEDTLGYHKSNTKIAELYTMQEIYYDDAITKLDDAIRYYNQYHQPVLEAQSYTLLSQIYEKKQEYDIALNSINKALSLNEEIKDTLLQLECNLMVTKLFSMNGNLDKAIELAENTLRLSQLLKEDHYIAENLLNLASFHFSKSDYKSGAVYLDESLIKRKGSKEQKARLYKLLSDYSLEDYDLAKSFDQYKKYIVYRDSIAMVSRKELMNSMAYEFETRDKEREIIRLEKDSEIAELNLQQQRRLVWILIFSLLAGLLAVFLIIRFYAQKISANQLLAEKQSQLDQQKIKDMGNDFKIRNLESMIIGQEEERKRISTDLHDSLGGMLSALKLQYDSLPLIHNELDKDEDYININSLIDTACDEVRNIARNLKPASLEKIGLKAALTDLVNRYKRIPNAEVTLHFHKTDKKLDYNTKVHVYRIVQELINNAIKHSKCQELEIQISSLNNEFVIMVEDDGVGFDKLKAVYGHGIENIRSRVNILKGDLQIDTQKDRGTSVIIHIPQYADAV